MNCERYEPDAYLWVETLDRFHQADVAFLDQVAERQPIAGIASRNVHDKSQMGQDQLLGRFEVIALAQLGGKLELLFFRQNRNATQGLDVMIQASDRPTEHQLAISESNGCSHKSTSLGGGF